MPSMPAADAQEWFGKPPPDLSLVARSRGSDWIFNFLTTFYADPASRQTGVNNLQLPGTAMPHVLASVQGVQNAVWDNVEHKGEDGKPVGDHREFKAFEPGVVGSADARAVRRVRARYGEFPAVRQRSYAARTRRASASGWCCSFSCSRASRTC